MKKLNKLADEIVANLVDCGSADDEPVEQHKEWTRKQIAKAFSALEQRAESAEAKLAELVPVYQQLIYGNWHDCDKGEYDCSDEDSRRMLIGAPIEILRNIEVAKWRK